MIIQDGFVEIVVAFGMIMRKGEIMSCTVKMTEIVRDASSDARTRECARASSVEMATARVGSTMHATYNRRMALGIPVGCAAKDPNIALSEKVLPH